MAIVQSCSAWKLLCLQAIIDTVLSDGAEEYSLRLFTNDVTLTFDTVTGDLSEPTLTGYAPIVLDSASWPTAECNGEGDGQTKISAVGWTFTGNFPETLYGWWVTNRDGDFVYGEKLWPLGLLIDTDGQGVTLTPRFVYGDWCPPA